MNFVLDASVALLWLAPASNPAGVDYAAATLRQLRQGQAVVPSLFALEIANVVAKLEAKALISEADSQPYIQLLKRLNIATDHATTAQALSDSLNLARRYHLSAYDAAYLELALRAGLPLATLDADLAKAATSAGVVLLEAAYSLDN